MTKEQHGILMSHQSKPSDHYYEEAKSQQADAPQANVFSSDGNAAVQQNFTPLGVEERGDLTLDNDMMTFQRKKPDQGTEQKRTAKDPEPVVELPGSHFGGGHQEAEAAAFRRQTQKLEAR